MFEVIGLLIAGLVALPLYIGKCIEHSFFRIKRKDKWINE